MAKWGQGDPRWIVEEREDGTNVNNWHWTERDATSLNKGKLRNLLVGIVVENETGHRVISELRRVEESGAKHKGLIEILSLSEENEVDDTEMNVSKKKGDGDIRKDLMKTAGTAKLSFGTSTLLEIQASSPTGLGVRIPTVTLHMTELFDPTVEQLYSIFTVKDLVQKFSKSLAILEAEKRGTFQMFDGNITGEYVELLTNKKIVMKWRHRNWPEEHHATVALSFVPTPGQMELQLDCKGVPVCKEEGMKSCWQKQHFEEIKCLLKLTTLNG
ncbi:LOW QUALITY PROTEIN: activator of 90 kDa heat shock protein ATPase homolog 2-like [Herpailurus yagouaroundi]|uniref:LOW QUALITY PROTEIN: activator of 90 kDa heat shock protein ATPase homolog 2-like n=1 Tax=Herpailurus yagouaroundi TaxID=1608482 RepID=UPI001AD66C6B|nr:LOW QUALITY PROTEIN: activator of 90 kDa heat shock protein ATPase homolog 2-like [Puma yagouaroundi]